MKPIRKPRYVTSYPLAAELVFSQRLADNAIAFTAWVSAASIKCYRALAASGARFNPNTDAADGKDISVSVVAGDSMSPKAAKKVESFLKHKAGGNWSRMTQERQKREVMAFLLAVRPVAYSDDSKLQKLITSLIGFGEFGAVPAYIASEVNKSLLTELATGFSQVESTYTRAAIKTLANNATEIQSHIVNGRFGLTDEYWQKYYQRFKVDGENLIDLVSGKAVTADTVGAVAADVAAVSKSVVDASVIPNLPALDSARSEIYKSAADDLQIIVKAASGRKLAPGVELPIDDVGNFISVNKFENNPSLLSKSETWIEGSMSRIEDLNADALKRGIKVVQEAIREGRGLDWVTEQLSKEMEISVRRARNIGRNEIGNHAWDTSFENARSVGMSIYLWHGMLDERERYIHLIREDKPYNPLAPPPDGNPGQPHGCRCFPEWLFDYEDVRNAEDEIAKRYQTAS
ncbi:phage minor head protein [Yersinia massiliensis]|uniref:phage minor head protein n=1 Tax=Yersinia massiliensis TaxID=419257 RepID=UPI001CFF027F|nr:phage minor head protein [Yersinia massiliensis]MCB5308340.1 phage head morphogenesis protein [Yersinia massiliensis]